MNLLIIILIIILVIILFFAVYLIAQYNNFVTLKNRFEEAFSTMDVYLQKRADLIPNLVETVKGYAKHEKETFEQVINARNNAINTSDFDEKVNAENQLTATLGKLFALAESYPDLKANANFIELQNQLNEMEQEIAQSRKYYNAVVKTFNTKVELFPSNIIASLFKFTRKPMFEVDNEQARKNVKVEF